MSFSDHLLAETSNVGASYEVFAEKDNSRYLRYAFISSSHKNHQKKNRPALVTSARIPFISYLEIPVFKVNTSLCRLPSIYCR